MCKAGLQKTYLSCMGSRFGSPTPAIYVGTISFTHVHTCDLTMSDLEHSFISTEQTDLLLAWLRNTQGESKTYLATFIQLSCPLDNCPLLSKVYKIALPVKHKL